MIDRISENEETSWNNYIILFNEGSLLSHQLKRPHS